ncbi:hypothetical protein F3Y22_tig00110502pilonHSYRG00007 [Hibiscus syriacus]|uniref:MATH domain-containing protein n=1 Tax=Hibiscus syriacus TaxID=106335 RepID=A0A6A3AH60_HIBSY|nr:protein RESTRICTED TEV MOVEMENT 3-like [Hibiscus syriacus]KAE8702112.1 hypothetical protein F3Y22_tig00110502pilonHSYRG00007 [Hibiscus syriacus]
MKVRFKFQCRDINEKLRKFTWRIDNLSTVEDEILYSEDFVVEGNKWRIHIYPKGNNVDYLSIYLGVANSATLPSGWSAYVQFGFAVIDQIDRRTSLTQGILLQQSHFYKTNETIMVVLLHFKSTQVMMSWRSY